ncbi:MAG: putative cytokinetic ring protein SteA [Bacillota bacterium]
MLKINIKGTAKVDHITKNLVKRLNPGDIAVIDHAELDDVAAHSLVEARVRAVINAMPSLSFRYPNMGPLTIVSSGITLVDNAGNDLMKQISDGQAIEITGGRIISNGRIIGEGKILSRKDIIKGMDGLKQNMRELLCDFVSNTLDHARNELGLITGDYNIPEVETNIKGRHVLIVVRGHSYKEDLDAVKPYIEEMKPLLMAVDGGADALLELGHNPDLIVGDMDSVSDRALCSGSELVAHAYKNGASPGLERIKKLGLAAKVFAAPGTSEDIALLLAYEKGADLIVMLGSHSNIIDFLEKGRRGMASTFLVRMMVGPKLVDAKGVSKLYKNRIKAKHILQLLLAAMLPAALVMFFSPIMKEILKLLYLQFKIILGI